MKILYAKICTVCSALSMTENFCRAVTAATIMPDSGFTFKTAPYNTSGQAIFMRRCWNPYRASNICRVARNASGGGPDEPGGRTLLDGMRGKRPLSGMIQNFISWERVDSFAEWKNSLNHRRYRVIWEPLCRLCSGTLSSEKAHHLFQRWVQAV